MAEGWLEKGLGGRVGQQVEAAGWEGDWEERFGEEGLAFYTKTNSA